MSAQAQAVLAQIFNFITADYDTFSLKKLDQLTGIFLQFRGMMLKKRLIQYIFRNGLFDHISGELQEAVVNLIDDTFYG